MPLIPVPPSPVSVCRVADARPLPPCGASTAAKRLIPVSPIEGVTSAARFPGCRYLSALCFARKATGVVQIATPPAVRRRRLKGWRRCPACLGRRSLASRCHQGDGGVTLRGARASCSPSKPSCQGSCRLPARGNPAPLPPRVAAPPGLARSSPTDGLAVLLVATGFVSGVDLRVRRSSKYRDPRHGPLLSSHGNCGRATFLSGIRPRCTHPRGRAVLRQTFGVPVSWMYPSMWGHTGRGARPTASLARRPGVVHLLSGSRQRAFVVTPVT